MTLSYTLSVFLTVTYETLLSLSHFIQCKLVQHFKTPLLHSLRCQLRINPEMVEVDEQVLEDLYSWIDEIPLSRPKKDLKRDFSDGGDYMLLFTEDLF